MNLTKQEMDQLWGGEGPYSEARLIMEHRILDDSVTRVSILVEVNINPYSFKLIKKDRDKFADDELIQALINNARYISQGNGYLSGSFAGKFNFTTDEEIMKKGKEILAETKKALIKIHQYVMKNIA